MAYTTETEIENYLLTTIDSSFSSQVSSWISMAQKWIDNYTDRTFEASTETKKYDGNGRYYLYVDDLLSVTTIWMVANDSTGDANTETLAATDFYLYQEDNPNKTPYNRIVLNPNGDYQSFELGNQNIWVKGSFGYSAAAPEDIQMVATKLVAGIIETGKNGGISSFTEGDYTVNYTQFERLANQNLSVKQILDWYKRKPLITTHKMLRI